MQREELSLDHDLWVAHFFLLSQSVCDLRSAMKDEIAAKPGAHGFPFDKLLECNIGNPQAVGQAPMNFPRQVLALLCCPSLLQTPGVEGLFAPDAIARAKEYLAAIPSGIGAYSESQGFRIVREQVAEFITNRDGGIPAFKEDIFLTDGASKVRAACRCRCFFCCRCCCYRCCRCCCRHHHHHRRRQL